MIVSSGAGRVEHFYEVFTETEAESALTAGIFHRKEVPINYITKIILDVIGAQYTYCILRCPEMVGGVTL